MGGFLVDRGAILDISTNFQLYTNFSGFDPFSTEPGLARSAPTGSRNLKTLIQFSPKVAKSSKTFFNQVKNDVLDIKWCGFEFVLCCPSILFDPMNKQQATRRPHVIQTKAHKVILLVLAQKGKRSPGWAVAILGWLEKPQKLGDTHNFSLAGKQQKEKKISLLDAAKREKKSNF